MRDVAVAVLAFVIVGGLLLLGAIFGFRRGEAFADRHACGECDVLVHRGSTSVQAQIRHHLWDVDREPC